MECNPETFELIAETKHFDVGPAVLANRDLLPVRYAFSSDEVLQHSARYNDVYDTEVRWYCDNNCNSL